MPNVGDRVIAQWPQEMEWWYPGVVVSSSGGAVEVQFDDGGRATLTTEQLRAFEVSVGDRVFCRWKGGNQYYPGRIGSQIANALGIDFDDGDKEMTSISMLRFHESDF